ncbi:MAG: thiolase family protein [Gammaproteobacteria bacterium]|nr:MAG: thiolase family protein [Gammaproteobacteria bacterium]
MKFNSEIPYGAYWSTPFAKWQGSLAALNSVEFAAWVAKNELNNRAIDPSVFDYGVLGTSVPQKHSFYGLPWLTGLMGAESVGGPTIGQACATGARILLNATQEIQSGLASCSLVVATDRCSNGPHLYYPNPRGPGGTGAHEDWVLDNFSCDPLGKHAMLDTAENVAKKSGITTEQQHEVVLRRQEQYQMATKDDNAFQKRYMTLPFEVPTPNYKRTATTLNGDEGLIISSADKLAELRPVKPDGSVTFGGQTHPADGNAALVLASPEKAQSLSKDPSIRIRVLGFGAARVELAHMPAATVPAAQQALANAGLDIKQMDAVKSHNPFAVNDIYFANEMGIDVNQMNNYGSSLIWGHPQAPTGLRSIIEMIEELVVRGGGYGLFEGCAAGDTAMAVVIQVDNRS